MTIQTFAWYPDFGSQQDCAPSVQVTKFGDGYEVRASAGLNTMPMKWSLTFTRDRVICQAILAFLRARAGVEAFVWANPLNESGKYVCRAWKMTSQVGEMVVTCDFEQVFEV